MAFSEKLTFLASIDGFSNRLSACYRSSITNEHLNKGNRQMLITRICNGHLTKTVTTTSYRSRVMGVSLGSHGPLVIGTKTMPVT
jgi:hypothetical protein